eukprot:3924464-Prymnesium_polylepis.1
MHDRGLVAALHPHHRPNAAEIGRSHVHDQRQPPVLGIIPSAVEPLAEKLVQQALVAPFGGAVDAIPVQELPEARCAGLDHHDTRVELVGRE